MSDSGFLKRSRTIGTCWPYFLSKKPKYTLELRRARFFLQINAESNNSDQKPTLIMKLLGQSASKSKTTEIRRTRSEATRIRQKNSEWVRLNSY